MLHGGTCDYYICQCRILCKDIVLGEIKAQNARNAILDSVKKLLHKLPTPFNHQRLPRAFTEFGYYITNSCFCLFSFEMKGLLKPTTHIGYIWQNAESSTVIEEILSSQPPQRTPEPSNCQRLRSVHVRPQSRVHSSFILG